MSDPTNLLVLAALAMLALTASMVVPRVWCLAGSLWTSVYQFFTLPVLNIYPPLTLVTSLALWPVLTEGRYYLRWRPLQLFVALLLAQFLSLAWSSDVVLGIRTIVYLLPFLLIFLTTCLLTTQAPSTVTRGLAVFALCALVEAGLVMLFRISPDIEEHFLRSGIARLFITPNALDLQFTDARNNVLDPTKSGGLFLNGNAASCFLGVSAMTVWGLGQATNSWTLRCLSLLLSSAVLFTGSKTGVLMVAGMGVLVYFANSLAQRLTYMRALKIVALVGIFAGASYIGQAWMESSGFGEQSRDSMTTRGLIWLHALRQFNAHPLLGEGFGGWEKSFTVHAANNGLSEGFPPHNTLIYLWSQSGLMAAGLGLAFMLSVLSFGVRVLRSGTQEGRGLGIAVLTAYLWTFLHGMADNTGLVGDLHLQPLLACLLGLTFTRHHGVPAERRQSAHA